MHNQIQTLWHKKYKPWGWNRQRTGIISSAEAFLNLRVGIPYSISRQKIRWLLLRLSATDGQARAGGESDFVQSAERLFMVLNATTIKKFDKILIIL